MDKERQGQFWASLALRHTRGLGPRTAARLLRKYGSAYAAVQACAEWGALGVRREAAASYSSGRWRETAQCEWNRAQCVDAGILLWDDPRYPARLRELADAPVLLYFRGDISLLSGAQIAVVGSRHCTGRGRRICAEISGQLSECGVTVVSGMARGVDKAAHSAALSGIGKSVGVLGTGIEIRYPPANEALFSAMAAQGLLLSEFAPGTPARPENFPVRNRIISGLSLGVVIVEAARRSGSLITARCALEQGREVYVVPAPAFASASEGCQALVRDGAHEVLSAGQILRDLAPQFAARPDAGKTCGTGTSFGPIVRDSDFLSSSARIGEYEAASDALPAGLILPAPAGCPPAGEMALNAQCFRHHEQLCSPGGEIPDGGGAVPAGDGTDVPRSGKKTCSVSEGGNSFSFPGGEDLGAAIGIFLAGHPGARVDTLCEELGKDAASVNAALVMLEMTGAVERAAGGRYSVAGRA